MENKKNRKSVQDWREESYIDMMDEKQKDEINCEV